MKCSYCGMEVPEGRKYCMSCGTKQEQTAEKKEPVWVNDLQEQKPVPAPVPVPAAPAPVAAPRTPVAEQPKKAPVKRVPVVTAPRLQLPTGRGLGKMFFLGILTLGIYPTVIWSRIVTELNLAASRYDGKRTMPYFAMCTLAPITLGIYLLVWMHKFCGRIGDELQRRGIDYKFGAKTFWLWNVLGSLILVGPFIFVHKLMKSMNQINEDFNKRG